MKTEEARERSKGGKLPPGVYWRHRTLWIAYYVTGPDGRRTKHREPTDAKSAREAGNLRSERITEHGRGERTVESRKLTVAEVLAAVVTDYEVNHRRSLATARGHVAAITAALMSPAGRRMLQRPSRERSRAGSHWPLREDRLAHGPCASFARGRSST